MWLLVIREAEKVTLGSLEAFFQSSLKLFQAALKRVGRVPA